MTATLTNADPSAAPPTHHPVRTREQAVGRALAVVLGLLTIFGPISMDLYLPVLPALTTELQSATSTAQLTITACLLGLAVGQLIAGPLSDRFGRRRPLHIGVAAYVVTSAPCALSPTIETLIVARFVQGLAGAVGIVIAQAAGRDLYSGRKLVRYYGSLTVLGGLAAIVGPVIGGQLATVTDWRGLFLFLAAVGVAILVASMFVFRETLPREHRVTGELTHMAHDFRRLLADRVFLGAVLVTGFTNAALFAYLSGATYVLQGIYRLSPQEYSFAFGLNSLGFMVFGYLAGRLSERRSEQGTLVVGLVMCTLGAGGLLATAALHLPLLAVVLSLLTMVSGVAVTSPPATALALANYPDIAGTASSLLGLARFAFGGLAAPLVGLGGAGNAVPLGFVTVVSAALAVIAYAMTIKPAATSTGRFTAIIERADQRPRGPRATRVRRRGRTPEFGGTMKKILAALTLSLFSVAAAAGAQAAPPKPEEEKEEAQVITRSGSQASSKGPAEYFTGDVRVQPLFAEEDAAAYGGGYVTFQPGARSAWHTHPAGQRLIVTEGVGRTQQWGGPVEEIRPGDVLWCPPGVKHWHGASPTSAMTHIALTGVRDGQNVEWLEKVSDEQYGDRAEHEDRGLTARQQAMATIAAFTAGGEVPRLEKALNEGLDAGLTVNEIKEILVQMYAYAGFPRSLNGITTFMAALKDREANGITDELGKEASPLPTDKSSVELGTENQTRLIGAPATGAYIAFAPAIDQFLKGHLFGDIFGRDNLDFQSREIATIAALANLDGVNSQLEAHATIGLNTGLTEAHMKGLVAVLRSEVGQKEADNASDVLNKVLNSR